MNLRFQKYVVGTNFEKNSNFTEIFPHEKGKGARKNGF